MLPTLVCGAAVLAVPTAASAASVYVDDVTGDDTNAACPIDDPCKTIGHAIGISMSNDEILVDSGLYPEQVTLGEGRSLRFQDFVSADGDASPVVDGGAGTAVTVPASGATLIEGLTIRGDAVGVQLNGAAEVDGNTFDDPDATSARGVATGAITGISIHDNQFVDPSPGDARSRTGVDAQSASAEITDNSFTGMMAGILVSAPTAGSTVVEGNTFTATHNLPNQGRAIGVGPGGAGSLVLRANTIEESGGDVDGILILDGPATLEHNEISGQQEGVHVGPNSTGVTLEGDRIWDNSSGGLVVTDLSPSAPQTSVSATNVTVADGAFNDGASLTLDSSIVAGIGTGAGATTCTITFSAGDTIGGDPTGCHDFSTTADPMFVDAGDGDLHLSPNSPMIDAGNPADPGVGAVDFDGDARALDGTPQCSGNVDRRDIGADEYAPALPDCTPPETTITKRPPKTTKKKKVKLEFESDEPGATFKCKLDGKAYEDCNSPLGLKVKPGRHVFRVFAIDEAANEDASPAKAKFTRKR